MLKQRRSFAVSDLFKHTLRTASVPAFMTFFMNLLVHRTIVAIALFVISAFVIIHDEPSVLTQYQICFFLSRPSSYGGEIVAGFSQEPFIKSLLSCLAS